MLEITAINGLVSDRMINSKRVSIMAETVCSIIFETILRWLSKHAQIRRQGIIVPGAFVFDEAEVTLCIQQFNNIRGFK